MHVGCRDDAGNSAGWRDEPAPTSYALTFFEPQSPMICGPCARHEVLVERTQPGIHSLISALKK